MFLLKMNSDDIFTPLSNVINICIVFLQFTENLSHFLRYDVRALKEYVINKISPFL